MPALWGWGTSWWPELLEGDARALVAAAMASFPRRSSPGIPKMSKSAADQDFSARLQTSRLVTRATCFVGKSDKTTLLWTKKITEILSSPLYKSY